MTVPQALVPRDGAGFRGATAAIDASSDRALAVAQSLARSLGMRTVRVAPDDRVAYHAAAAAPTGPVARGDELTVAAQRAAVAERAPELLELFDALTETTRTLATSTLATSTLATSTLATSAAGRA
jgi:predicted short-subunit dehydrogenase-like oxidoreductase (DUF2520 family)